VTGSLSDHAASWRPLGAALLDYHHGDRRAAIVVESDLWEDELTPVETYYRPTGLGLPDLEREALRRCRGRVLDLGAGAGRHALELQAAGCSVVAVDPLEEAVEIMRDRGVADPRRGDLRSVAGERFDTVLMLMNGIGVVGDLHGLGLLLEELPQLLRPDGQLICDSADLAAAIGKESPELFAELSVRDSYLGEVEFSLRYRSLVGLPYPWLFIDPQTLGVIAGAAGFDATAVAGGDRGSYLAVLTEITR
jgi:SAM-dependent methyltransferase